MRRVGYDMNLSPPTYDVVAALLYEEAARLARGEQHIEFVFLPGPRGGFRADGLWPQSVAEREYLLKAIAMPMAAMLPSCLSVTRVTSRDGRIDGMGQRRHGLDIFVRAMATAGRPLRPKIKRPFDPCLVTITLRECTHWPERNSNMVEWKRAAATIAGLGFDVVVVRDTLNADQSLGGFQIDGQAAVDLECRASLYRSAFCNLFVSNGPAWFALALDAPVLMLKPTTESLGRCYSADYLASCGLPKGGQLPSCPRHQRIVWQDDKADIIVRSFEEFAMAQERLREAV